MSKPTVRLEASNGAKLTVVVEHLRAWEFQPPSDPVPGVLHKTPGRTVIWLREVGIAFSGDHTAALDTAMTGFAS